MWRIMRKLLVALALIPLIFLFSLLAWRWPVLWVLIPCLCILSIAFAILEVGSDHGDKD